MIILLHVLIALASLAVTTLTVLRPSVAGLRATYGLIAATLASGAYLLVSTPGHMLSTCLTGLLYLGVSALGLAGAYYRLAKQEQA